jgi:TPR repeat protein
MSRVLSLAIAALISAVAPAIGPVMADGTAGLKAYQQGDFATALAEFMPLAEAGQASAQAAVGQMYLNGEGVPQDPAQAAIWLEKAAEGGNARARYQIGNMYAAGMGVPVDDMKASYYLIKAANQNMAVAQLAMAQRFYHGQGVPKDVVQSFLYAALSAKQGNQDGAAIAQTIGASLTPEQQAQAQTLFESWQPSAN